MKKVICRNIAIVTAIFIVTFSIMLVANYFQVRGISPLETGIMETMKELNDANANHPALQEQIRQLDLMARKAYFVQHDQLMNGVYILLGMLAVFFVCARLYFTGVKDIPDKEIDPVDEWAIKTKARKYVLWGASGIAATALVFAVLSSPQLKASKPEQTATSSEIADSFQTDDNAGITSESFDSQALDDSSEATDSSDESAESSAEETPAQSAASAVTHNAFRGNNANGISTARNIPVKWDLARGTNIAWKIANPRQGHNSPLINGNKVFFTGADEEVRELYCYDLTTGKQLWTLKADNIPGSPEKVPDASDDTGWAAPSAATNGRQVCAIFATGDLICADMDGKRLWAKNIGVPDNHYAYAHSLLTLGNLLFVQFDDRRSAKVTAYDIATGAERWSTSRQERLSWASPIIAHVNNTPQLVLMGNPSITAYNPNNGQQLWRVVKFGGEPGASACSADGIVYTSDDHMRFVAINAADGTVLWEKNDFLTDVASPVATKDNIYMATTYGLVLSFDTQTGEPRVEHELGGTFFSSPMIADGKVFAICDKGKVFIFTADDEFKLLDSFETGEATFATPAFTDGKIVVRTEKSIYCVAVK